MTQTTTASRLVALMAQTWEGGPEYDLTFETAQGREAGKLHNANDVIERLWPNVWAKCDKDGDDFRYTFEDGSTVIVAPTGDAITDSVEGPFATHDEAKDK